MATSPPTLPPPPGGPGQDDQPGAPTSPAAAAPAPPQPSGAMQQGVKDVINLVSLARGIAKAFPSTSPEIMQINDLVRQVQQKMMASQNPGEPMAPPTNG